jgi:hypothetical protein
MKINEIIVERRQVLDPERSLIVWENPSYSELRDLINQFGELRGGADANGPLVVWDAASWVHSTVGQYYHYGYPFEFYYYFSKTPTVQAEEWASYMRKVGDVFVGVKNPDEKGRNKPKPALEHPRVIAALRRSRPVVETTTHTAIIYRAMNQEEADRTLLLQQPSFKKRFKFFSTDYRFIENRVRDGKFAHSQYKDEPYRHILQFEILSGFDQFVHLNSKELMLDVRKTPLINFGNISKINA